MQTIAQYHQKKQKDNDSIGFALLGFFIVITLFGILPLLSYIY